jgi:hypothetical protein
MSSYRNSMEQHSSKTGYTAVCGKLMTHPLLTSGCFQAPPKNVRLTCGVNILTPHLCTVCNAPAQGDGGKAGEGHRAGPAAPTDHQAEAATAVSHSAVYKRGGQPAAVHSRQTAGDASRGSGTAVCGKHVCMGMALPQVVPHGHVLHSADGLACA